MITFVSEVGSLIRLVAHHRVFFDKRSGKAERIEQFIVERGIVYGLQIGLGFAACLSKNLIIPQFPRLPLFIEILQILTRLLQIERKTKYYESFSESA